MESCFKIVEICDDNIPRTLFHGHNRTRKLPVNVWIEAVQKMVSDGTGRYKYLSGFHVLRTHKSAYKYARRFKNTKNKYIIPCYADGLRVKPRSRDNVYLADKIMIPY